MNRRFEITDDEWERLAPLLPAMTPQRGGRWRDHRQVLNGILFRVRTGIPWRDLPERFGNWNSVWRRFRRWAAAGVWGRVLAAVRDEDVSTLILDSTVVRAHPSAAGAKKKPAPRPSAAARAGTGRRSTSP
jgi:transposase